MADPNRARRILGYKPEPKEWHDQRILNLIKDSAHGLAEGATLGFYDELYGLGASGGGLWGDYTEARDAARKSLKKSQARNPLATHGAEIASILIPGAGLVKAGQLGTKGVKAAQSVKKWPTASKFGEHFIPFTKTPFPGKTNVSAGMLAQTPGNVLPKLVNAVGTSPTVRNVYAAGTYGIGKSEKDRRPGQIADALLSAGLGGIGGALLPVAGRTITRFGKGSREAANAAYGRDVRNQINRLDPTGKAFKRAPTEKYIDWNNPFPTGKGSGEAGMVGKAKDFLAESGLKKPLDLAALGMTGLTMGSTTLSNPVAGGALALGGYGLNRTLKAINEREALDGLRRAVSRIAVPAYVGKSVEGRQ